MNADAIARLLERLAQINTPAASASADDVRTAIVSGYCAEAICTAWPRVGGKVKTFRAMFEIVYGVPLDTRERRARGASAA